mgnify:CR=1 FL=1
MNQDLSIVSLILNASWVVQGVVALLVGVSIASWAAIFRKIISLKRVQSLNDEFDREFWSGTSLNDLYAAATQNAKSSGPMERIFASGMREYQKQRVITFLDPESDPLGAGWNIIQSKIAIGSGGIEGKGWLQGTQSHLDFLPETHTDFIVAVLAEEFGLIGVCALLSLYLLVLIRGLMIAGSASHPFDRMLAASLTLTFFVYVVVNIGMVSGLLPVVGVPLPLVSYGGTAAVTLTASLGLLMSIHARRPQRT